MTPSQFITKIDAALAAASTATNSGFNASLTRAISGELIQPETHARLKRHFETVVMLHKRMAEVSIGRANEICELEHQANLEKFSREMTPEAFGEWIKNARNNSQNAKMAKQDLFRPLNQRIRAEIATLEMENSEAGKDAIRQALPALKSLRDSWVVEENRKAALLNVPFAQTVSIAALSAQIEKLERQLTVAPREFNWNNLDDFWSSICVKPTAPAPSPVKAVEPAPEVARGQVKTY